MFPPSDAPLALQTKNIALQGTLCVSGSGRGLVFQIGDNTVLCVFPVSPPDPPSHGHMRDSHSGRIAKLSSAAMSLMTTLQRELIRFVVIIAGMATAVAIFIVILWAAW